MGTKIEKIQKQRDNIKEEIEVLKKNIDRLRSKKEKLDDNIFKLSCEEKRKKYLDKYLGKIIHIHNESNDIEHHIVGRVYDHDGRDYFFVKENAVEYVLKGSRLEHLAIKKYESIAEYYDYSKHTSIEIIEDSDVVSILKNLFMQKENELKETKRKIAECMDLLTKK